MSVVKTDGAAIYFVARDLESERVIGLDVAVERLVDAYLRYARPWPTARCLNCSKASLSFA